MPQQRIDFIVTYTADNGKVRKRTFWNEKDARAYTDQVEATRIEKTTIEIIWESDELDSDSPKLEPGSTSFPFSRT